MLLALFIGQICPVLKYQGCHQKSYLLVFFLSLTSQSCSHILRLACEKYANFNVEEPNKKLPNPFTIIHGIDKPQCQYECIVSKECKAFNINEDELICELSNKSTEAREDNVTTVVANGWTCYSTSYNETLIGRNCAERRPCKKGFICYDTCECPGHRCVAMQSCLDWRRRGGKNGIYEVVGKNDTHYPVICDFESENASVWTLITSFSLANKNLFKMPFYKNVPISEENPNWVNYRQGRQRMNEIRSSSRLWRATCSFPTHKSNIFRDYVRAQLEKIDIIEHSGNRACRDVDYINIRGHEGSCVTVPFWQNDNEIFHTDSSIKSCVFDALNGSITNEDNFGLYVVHNRNFKCTEFNSSTTQYWFGDNI